jgi:hypothetical protein
MKATKLLAELQLAALELKLRNGKLQCRSLRHGSVSKYYRRQIDKCRPGLLALVMADSGLPPGTRLFFEGDKSALCWPEESVQWTWEGAPSWLFTADRPLPPCEPALHPRSGRRCRVCQQALPGVSWQTCMNGEKRLRLACQRCGVFCGWLKKDPRNPDLIWRTIRAA